MRDKWVESCVCVVEGWWVWKKGKDKEMSGHRNLDDRDQLVAYIARPHTVACLRRVRGQRRVKGYVCPHRLISRDRLAKFSNCIKHVHVIYSTPPPSPTVSV